MFGIDRTGVRFVLSNFEEGREDDASAWYDSFEGQILFDGLLVNANRFENPRAAGTDEDPSFATIYDFVAEDLAAAWPATTEHPDFPAHMLEDPRFSLVSVPLLATYSLEGEEGEGRRELTGVTLILNDSPADDARAAWAKAAVATGLFTAYARFELVDGEPQPQASLEVFETVDPDPASVLERVSEQIGRPPAADGARHYEGAFKLVSTASTPRGELAE